jgi:predicted DNA-binding transcriptional regulator YafY
MRLYRVSRIIEGRLLDERFEKPADFDLADYWEAARDTFIAGLPRYPVTVRASAQMCEMLPEIYGKHLLERIEDAAEDEAGWRTFILNYDNFNSAKNELMGLGAEIEVVEPSELREAILTTAVQLVARYAAGVPVLAD